jgi:hypothetical protein
MRALERPTPPQHAHQRQSLIRAAAAQCSSLCRFNLQSNAGGTQQCRERHHKNVVLTYTNTNIQFTIKKTTANQTMPRPQYRGGSGFWGEPSAVSGLAGSGPVRRRSLLPIVRIYLRLTASLV